MLRATPIIIPNANEAVATTSAMAINSLHRFKALFIRLFPTPRKRR